MSYSEQPHFSSTGGHESVGSVVEQVLAALSELNLAAAGAAVAVEKLTAANAGLETTLEGTRNQHALAGREAAAVALSELTAFQEQLALAMEAGKQWVEGATGRPLSS